MKNKKIKLFALSALLLLGGGAYIASRNATSENGVVAHAAETVTISTAEDFKLCFDGNAKYCNSDIVLANDIDLDGYEFSGNTSMAGEYTGTFDGQGHTIKNFSANCLFNIIGSTGVVKNLNVIGNKIGSVSGYGFLSYNNNGTISNCFVSVTVKDACNTYGAFALMNNGTISNSASYMAVANSGGNTFYSFARDAGTIIACTYNADNTALVAKTGDAVLDTNITVNSRGATIESTKLTAPTNATLSEDNIITFDEVENATSYYIEYRDSNGKVVSKQTVSNNTELNAIMANGTYDVYIRAKGNSVEYLDSDFVQVNGLYVLSGVVAKDISINEKNTHIQGAGVEVYLADKPNITVNDISVELISFNLPENPNATTAIKTIEVYDSSTGRLYFTLTSGYNASQNAELQFAISYVYNNEYYSSNVSFVSNAYVSNLTKAYVHYQYDDDDNPTAVRLIGEIENVDFDNIDKAEFIVALDGDEKTLDVTTLYTSISDCEEFQYEDNKYYAVYVINGLNAVDNEGNFKYRDRNFSVDFKVTFNDETSVTSESGAKSFVLAPTTEETTETIAIDETKTKIVGAGVEVYLADKPNITLDDITVTIDEFNSTDYAGYRDIILSNGVNKIHYIKGTGEFCFEIKNGFPNDSDIEIKFTISYSIDGTNYSKQLTFVGNHYVA